MFGQLTLQFSFFLKVNTSCFQLSRGVCSHSSSREFGSSWNHVNVSTLRSFSPMLDPLTVGDAVLISEPTLSWETEGNPVNEGPGTPFATFVLLRLISTSLAALYHGGRTWLFYSASFCWSNYKLGRLELIGSDPLNPSSWQKYPNPVFTAANGDYG